jgi:hypothetical protein
LLLHSAQPKFGCSTSTQIQPDLVSVSTSSNPIHTRSTPAQLYVTTTPPTANLDTTSDATIVIASTAASIALADLATVMAIVQTVAASPADLTVALTIV